MQCLMLVLLCSAMNVATFALTCSAGGGECNEQAQAQADELSKAKHCSWRKLEVPGAIIKGFHVGRSGKKSRSFALRDISAHVCEAPMDWHIFKIGPFNTRGGDWVDIPKWDLKVGADGSAFDAFTVNLVTHDGVKLRYPEMHVHHFIADSANRTSLLKSWAPHSDKSYAWALKVSSGPFQAVSDFFCHTHDNCNSEFTFQVMPRDHAFVQLPGIPVNMNMIFNDLRSETAATQQFFIEIAARQVPFTTATTPVQMCTVGLTSGSREHYLTFSSASDRPQLNYVTIRWPANGNVALARFHSHLFSDEIWIAKGSADDLGLSSNLFGRVAKEPIQMVHMGQESISIPRGFTLGSTKAFMLDHLSKGSTEARLLCRVDMTLWEEFPDFDGYETKFNYMNTTSTLSCQHALRAANISKGDRWTFVTFSKQPASYHQHGVAFLWMAFDDFTHYVRKQVAK